MFNQHMILCTYTHLFNNVATCVSASCDCYSYNSNWHCKEFPTEQDALIYPRINRMNLLSNWNPMCLW